MEKMYCDREKEHALVAQRAKEEILSPKEVDAMCSVFHVLSDPTRMKIVLALMQGEMCVYHLAEVTEISVSGVSHQLRYLREKNIVKAKRLGKNIEYSLADSHIQKMVAMGLEHLACDKE